MKPELVEQAIRNSSRPRYDSRSLRLVWNDADRLREVGMTGTADRTGTEVLRRDYPAPGRRSQTRCVAATLRIVEAIFGKAKPPPDR